MYQHLIRATTIRSERDANRAMNETTSVVMERRAGLSDYARYNQRTADQRKYGRACTRVVTTR